MRPPFAGHRRYSITHRAVQRLRELVSGSEDLDDEGVRDRLDVALATAEDDGKAIRTLDAMLAEPQTLVPVADFGETLWAIIKEETVVTVLPQGHGEEILQRGQAMQERVRTGQAREDEPRVRRPPRKDVGGPVVIERLSRPGGPGSTGRAQPLVALRPEPRMQAKVVEMPERAAPSGPVASVLSEALEHARRRAAVSALTEVLARQDRDASLLPLWNELAQEGVPVSMTVGDLIDAVRGISN